MGRKKGAAIFLILAMLISLAAGTVYAEELSNKGKNTTPAHRKYIRYDKEDRYTLALDITGKAESVTGEKPKVDVLLIVDRSNSMKKNMYGGDDTGYWNPSRLKILKNVVTGAGSYQGKGLTDSIFKNEGMDARMSVVAYSGEEEKHDIAYNDAYTVQTWTDSQSAINSAVEGIDADGGTNCEAGLYTAVSTLSGARADAQKYVIFLSDGDPTYYYNDRGQTEGTGSRYDPTAAEHAYTQAEKITGLAGFYTIGFSSDSNPTFMKTLKEKAGAEKRGYYGANDADELAKVFKEITADITEYTCRNVTITDTLSEYVQIPDDGFQYNIEVKDENGQVQTLPSDAKIAVNYDAGTRSVTAKFPKDYALKAGWTYVIYFPVVPSQKAYDEFAETGYPHTGSTNSDAVGNQTSSGQKGFYANTSAKLTFTYGTQSASEKTVDYAEKPVVQVSALTIPVEKQWGNAEETKRPESVTVYLHQDGKQEAYRTLELSANTGWKGNFEKVAKGHTYTISEKEVPGFVTSVTGDAAKGFVVTNTKLPTLSISKEVTGTMGDKTKKFSFTVQLKSETGQMVNGSYDYIGGVLDEINGVEKPKDGKLVFVDGKAEIALSHGQKITIQNLPVGSSYKVEEKADADYKVIYNGEESERGEGVLKKDENMAVVNERDFIPDTGISADSSGSPFILGAGGLLIFAVITFFLRRRSRCHI